MLICVLKQVVFHTVTRFYTILNSQRLCGMSHLKKHYAKVMQKNFAIKKYAPIFIQNTTKQKSSRCMIEVDIWKSRPQQKN